MTKSVSRLDKAGAHRRAQRVRDGVMAVNELIETLVEIQEHQDWLSLGYKTWTEYYEGEFGPTRLKLSAEQRGQVVAVLAASGMSKRKVAAALGIDEKTVRNDLRGAEKSALPSGKPQVKDSGDVDSPPIDVPGQTAAEGALVPSADGPSRETANTRVVEGPAGDGGHGAVVPGKPQDSPVDVSSTSQALPDPAGAQLIDEESLETLPLDAPAGRLPASDTPGGSTGSVAIGRPGTDHPQAGEAAATPAVAPDAAASAQPAEADPSADELGGGEASPPVSLPPGDPDTDDPAADWLSTLRWLDHAAAEVLEDLTERDLVEVGLRIDNLRRVLFGIT
jgi:hypothetical protein